MEWMGVATLIALGATISLYLYYRTLKSSAKRIVKEAKQLEIEGRHLKTKLG